MKKVIIANWKMNLGFRDSMKLATELSKLMPSTELTQKDVVICPSTSSLLLLAEILKEHLFSLGVQDLFWEDKGAFTGCESPKFMYESGCRYAIIGHSERRQNLGETNEMVHKKIKTTLEAGLTPILCVGETYEERSHGSTDNIIMGQVIKALSGIDLTANENLIIAYEPVWVIGSGRAIELSEAEHAFKIIYQSLLDLMPQSVANSVRIIYGGSVDGKNSSEFNKLEHFSGFLVGGASLRAEEFISIVKQTK
jgi:triosephosphate isomerase (TIM)